jgi:hypothetical protein
LFLFPPHRLPRYLQIVLSAAQPPARPAAYATGAPGFPVESQL